MYHVFHGGKQAMGKLFVNVPEIAHMSSASVNGYLAVDMFFIMAGFFLFYATDFSIDVIDFVKKKLIRLYPLVVLFVGLDILCHYVLWGHVHYVPHDQALRLLLIDNVGFNFTHSGITWYVSVLFWVMVLFFYLYKNFDKKYLNLVFGLAIWLCYEFLIQVNHGKVAGNTVTYAYVFNTGLLRGVGGMAIGYFVWQFWRGVKPVIQGLWAKLFYTLVEVFLLFFVVNNLLFHKLKYETNLLIILGFVGLFLLFLLKRGWISQFLEKDILVLLGRYSYSIFIMHIFAIRILRKFVWVANADFVIAHPYLNVLFVLLLSVLFGVIVYHLVEKPVGKFLYMNKILQSK